MDYSFQQLGALTDQCAEVVHIVQQFSEIIRCVGEHVSSCTIKDKICDLTTDNTGVIYADSVCFSFDIHLGVSDRIQINRPRRFRFSEQIVEIKDDDCHQLEELGKQKDYQFSSISSNSSDSFDMTLIFSVDQIMQKIYVYNMNQKFVTSFDAKLDHRILVSCVFVKNKLLILYEMICSERLFDEHPKAINWEIHVFDCRGNYSRLFCHGPRCNFYFGETLKITSDSYGHVYVSSFNDNKVYKYFTDGSQSGEINVLRPLDIVVSANDELFVISNEFLVNVYSCQFGQFNQLIQPKRSFSIKPSFAMALLPNGKIVVGGDDHISVFQ